MKKLLALTLSLLMVFSLVPMTMASAAGPVVEVFQDFEKDVGGLTATNSNAWRTTSYFYEGAYSYRTIGKTGVWDQNGKVVSSSNYKNYVKIALPEANIVGAVGFYAMKTQSNTSKFEAVGVQFADGTMYFTKFSTGTVTKSWTNINFVGRTMYKYGDSATTKVIAVEDFNNDTNKVTHLILVTGGSSGSGYETYIDNIYYETDIAKSSYIITIDGEQVAEVPFGETFTVPTPAEHKYYTDGTNSYYGGEVITPDDDLELTTKIETATLVYTMDEGKQMVGGATANIGYGKEGAEYLEVNGDYKLAIKVKSDQRGYFQLPSSWSSKPYFKPVSLKIEFNKNISGTVSFRNLDFSTALGSNNQAGGDVYKIFESGLTGLPVVAEIAITEEMYDCKYVSGVFYASASWSESAPVYAYVDNVTVTYEYDFDYVEPEPEVKTYNVSIDGEVVATVVEGETFKLPALEAGRYYIGYGVGEEIVVTGDIDIATALYDCDIKVDGVVVATVKYGTTYTLPELEAGKYYVDVTETTFVVTEGLEFTTATYTYDVTIDGVVVATVAYGETFTLPAVAEGMQYVDGFVAGQEFTVTEALSFATEEIPEFAGESTTIVETDDKASIRLGEVSGIRFYTKIDTAALAELVGDEEYQVGTLIAPKDIAGDYLTAEDDCAIVPYDMNEELWDGEIVGSIVNIKPKNWARDFVARAYVLVDGVYYYSDVQCVRNIAGIADAYMTDANSDFANLDANTQAMVEAWAKAND